MTESEKVENIIGFLSIILGNEPFVFSDSGTHSALYHKIMDLSPAYLIEKWERYVRLEEAQKSVGIHPVLRRYFIYPYMEKWKLKEGS